MDIEQTIQLIMDQKKLSRDKIQALVNEQIQELSGLIDEEGAIMIVAKNLGVDLQANQQAAAMETDQPISHLAARMNASVVGRIVNIDDIRKFNRKDGSEGVLLPFLLQDTTGMLKVLCWGPQHAKITESAEFAVNEILRVVNGFVKPNRDGQLELHVGDRSALQLNPDQVDRTMIPEIPQAGSVSYTPLKDLTITQPFFNIEGTIANVYPPKSFKRKDGSDGKRASVNIIDKTGSVYITFWGDHCDKLTNIEAGQSAGITKLKPKKNYMDPTKIDLTATSGTTFLESNLPGITTPATAGSPTGSAAGSSTGELAITPIQTISTTGGFGNLEGQIQTIEDQRTVNLRDGTQKNLLKFVFADETGAIRITLWGDQIRPDLQPGQAFRITGVMVKENSFSKQMEGNLTRSGTMEPSSKQFTTTHTVASPTSSQSSGSEERTSITEIQKDGFYTFKGTVIQELKRITTYRACSKCNRKVDNCRCPTPGTPVNRMILNLLLDDGKATIRGTLMGDTAEEFLGEPTDQVALMNESGEIETLLQTKNRDLLGTDYIFHGKAKYSDYSESYEVNINRFQILDPTREAREIIDLIQEK